MPPQWKGSGNTDRRPTDMARSAIGRPAVIPTLQQNPPKRTLGKARPQQNYASATLFIVQLRGPKLLLSKAKNKRISHYLAAVRQADKYRPAPKLFSDPNSNAECVGNSPSLVMNWRAGENSIPIRICTARKVLVLNGDRRGGGGRTVR